MADIYQYDKKSEQAMIDTDTGKRHKERYIENLRNEYIFEFGNFLNHQFQ